MEKFFADELIIETGGIRKNLQGLQIIGQGDERICLFDPTEPAVVYKLSRRHDSPQAKREIAYFKFLKRRRVPFTHIPEFYGSLKTKLYLIVVQEYIGSSGDFIVNSLSDVVSGGGGTLQLTAAELQSAFNELKAYLIQYRIVPNDMLAHNILLKKNCRDGSIRPYLIDGFGTHAHIKLKNYIRPLIMQAIDHECHKLVRDVRHLSEERVELQP